LGERDRGSNERLRTAVLESGLAMEDVAGQAGMDPKTLERAIRGERLTPGIAVPSRPSCSLIRLSCGPTRTGRQAAASA
jgi:hypothetical protein